MSDDIDFNSLNFYGWVNDPEAVQAVIQADGIRPVSEYIGVTAGGERPVKTDLTVYLKKLYGDAWYIEQRTCGSCCAFGAAIACDILTAIDVVDHGMEKPVGRTDPMTIYFGSRVEIGGNRLLGQGSVGVWCAKWLKDYGVIPQAKYPEMDLTTYDPRVCCGPHARQGVPAGLEAIARQHPVKSYAQVSTFEEAARAIEAGYPITVASDQGFSRQRDANGFARPSGSWSHQMTIGGIRHDIPGALLINSWGPYFSGQCDVSPACFWADARTVERMLRQGDSFALSSLQGWPRKSLNFARLNF